MMKLLVILPLVLLISCILRPSTAGKKFMALHHELRWHLDGLLVNKVHAPHWNISYGYGNDCPPEAKNNDEALTAALSKALRTWLQPLRDYSDKPIVKDFRYQKMAAVPFIAVGDLWIVFHCELMNSGAAIGAIPGINLRRGTKVVQHLMSSLVHEVGHVFGLADTYISWQGAKRDLELNRGGLASTKGTQPASVMSLYTGAWVPHKAVVLDGLESLSKDDIDGIVWLYKHVHEGLPLENCFFPAYELEEDPLGCRPKYPLIFEIKQGREYVALLVLEDDPKLDINAQDKDGLTALHHAVLNNFERLVNELITHHAIKPFLKSIDGHSALDLARQLELPRLAALIAAHPKAMPVAAKGKQTTTWGELKKEE